MKTWFLVLVLAAVAACSAVAGEDPATAASPERASVGGGLVRGGDRVVLQIWNEPEMSDTFAVAASGTVTLPRIGAVDAGDRTVEGLQDYLQESFTEYLANPSVNIVVLRRVGVIGEVRSPGLYFADLSMTVPDLIARAGGATPAGDLKKITLFRGGQQFNLSSGDRQQLSLTDLQSGDQIVIGERSYFARNAVSIVGVGVSVVTLMAQLLLTAI